MIVCATCHLNHGRRNRDGSISLYAGKGVAGGDLCSACTTCHDNHRRSVRAREEAGMHSNTVPTSFLRGRDVASTVCSNCHWVRALYLYRFYHQERAFRVRIPNR